ncbi:hypothetical protein LX32DRAFT_633414 [Colletotrichum zoysiae]|uniref:Cell wall protein n=1 Tax=Colletotrichum zoysiae TaxID=1216348 RepID=A0AAD9HVQ8_9PEZI|nr:hypothetical protein LX32DRAFT_633414 [Colletotrichum zoysiae]
MHYALFSVVLAASAMAIPAPKKGQNAGAANNAVDAALQTKVLGTINQWLGDIQTVNNFVDTAGQLKSNAEISNAAATAFVAAQNEGDSSNAIQADVKLDAKGQAAAQALNAQFNIIGPAINDTIANPQNLQANLAKINGARCPAPVGQDAIGNEGAVQAAGAKAVGTNVAPPDVPKACSAGAASGQAAAAGAAGGKANAAGAADGKGNAKAGGKDNAAGAADGKGNAKAAGGKDNVAGAADGKDNAAGAADEEDNAAGAADEEDN